LVVTARGFALRVQIPDDLRVHFEDGREKIHRFSGGRSEAEAEANRIRQEYKALFASLREQGPAPAIMQRIKRLRASEANTTPTQADRDQYRALVRRLAEAVTTRAQTDPSLSDLADPKTASRAVDALLHDQFWADAAEDAANSLDRDLDDDELDDATQAASARTARNARLASTDLRKSASEAAERLSPILQPKPPKSENCVSRVEARRRTHNGLTPQTIKAMDVYAERFVEIFGDIDVSEITRDHVKEFRDIATKIPHYRGARRSVKELMKLGGKTISPEGVKRHLTWLKALLQYAFEEGLVTANVAAGTKAPAAVKRQTDRKQPYSPAQAREILGLLETHWRDAKRPARLARFWLVRALMAFGARPNEISQLRKQDVFMDGDGIWCIRITDEASGQSLKTRSSLRTIPLPESLIQAGFLGWVEAQKEGFLFAVIVGDKTPEHGHIASRITGDFSTQILARATLVIDPETNKRDLRYSLNSCRHTVIRAGRRAKVTERALREFCGHSARDAHSGYGGRLPAVDLKKEIDLIDVFN
jgi:integrase